jgi:hypothetical protein
MEIRDDAVKTPNPLPNFQEHFTVLCNLLRAFAKVSDRPTSWSEDIIAKWYAEIVGAEAEEDDLEHPLGRVLNESAMRFGQHTMKFEDKLGTLYVTTAAELLTLLQKLNLRDLRLPKNAGGLTKRLNASSFQGFTYLKTDTAGISALERKSYRKPLGFFKTDDVTEEAAKGTSSVIS